MLIISKAYARHPGSGPVTIGGEAAPMTVAGSPVSIILIISFLRIGEVSLAADKDY